MLKKTGVVVALLGIVGLSSLLMSCGSGNNRPAGILYVVSQSLVNISSYAVDLGSGELSLINSDLADTCHDTSCGLPLTISVDPSGATAFVMSQNAISGLTVNSDGSLSNPTTVATLPSGQTALAMSSTAAGDMLAVISVGLPSPTDCPDMSGVYGSDCPLISMYSTQPGSTSVTPTGSLPLSRIPTAVSLINFTFPGQSAKTLLFVTSNHDLTAAHNDSELSMYLVDSSGTLTTAVSLAL